MSDDAVEVVREVFKRFAEGGDPFPLLDENVIFDVPMVPSHYEGHRGVAEFFRTWIGTWDDYKVSLEDLMPAPDGRVLAMFCEEGSGRGSGVPVHLHPAAVWEVRDGKVVSFKGFTDHAEAFREAGLSA